MRALLLAMLTVSAVSALDAAPAQARELPFCIKGQGYADAHGYCNYWTYEQCQAAASGRLNYCDANPFYNGPDPEDRRPRRRYRDRY